MQVKIPNDFFLNEAKKEYYDYKTRLVTELIQNEIDAGGTLIQLEFGDSGYSCSGNGRGMTRERMIEGMLTMGGSVKASGSTGCHGAAKKLILFSHQNYSILSRDTKATGSLLEYNLEDVSDYNGTVISATYINPEDFPKDKMIEVSKKFFQSSYLNADIYVNGEKLTEKREIGEFNRKFAVEDKVFGDIYVDKENKSSCIYILANGLYSFYAYVGGDIEKTTINITAPSKDTFSQSRDCFIGECKDLLSKLITEINQNNKSWHKKRPPVKILRGHNNYWKNFVEEALKVMKVEWPENAFDAFNLSVLIDMAEKHGKKDEIEELHNRMKHNVDFYFDGGNSGEESLPEEYHPKIGLKRNRFLAAIYKACIEDVTRIDGSRLKFCLGFTFDSDTKAAYKLQDDYNVFFINPLKCDYTDGPMKNRFWQIYSAAVHEVVHYQGFTEHNEYYACAITELMAKCFANTEGYVKIMNKAREYENNL